MATKKTVANAAIYIDSLPEEQQVVVSKIRSVIKKNLPKGFTECIQYGMIGYAVPLTLYPKGYHCDPSQPLPFLSLAAQKNSINLYHMGMYADPDLASWFKSAYQKALKKKPDMGKSCLRFKVNDQIPFELIGQLVSKMKPADWIRMYEKNFRK